MDSRQMRRRFWREQRGSNVAQAAAVALVAATLIAAVLTMARGGLAPAVDRAFTCLASAITGGGGCGIGTAPSGGGALPSALRPLTNLISIGAQLVQPAPGPIATHRPPDASLKPCPSVPNAGIVDNPMPQDLIGVWDNLYKMYQGGAPTQQGPIGITQIGEGRYLVQLVGVEELGLWGAKKYNNLNNATAEALGGTSPYQEQVRATIEAQIPPGSEIIFAGHSEGGIVAQNLAASHSFNTTATSWWNSPWNEARRRLGWGQQGKYRVTHVITYGSPMSQVPVSGVEYRMITTKADPVSHLPLLGRGGVFVPRQIEIPTVFSRGRFDWLNPTESHGVYGESLRAVRDDPQSSLRNAIDLPFRIDQWSQTETYHANDEAKKQTDACN
jgi:Flp pilus assembly pilin Flp